MERSAKVRVYGEPDAAFDSLSARNVIKEETKEKPRSRYSRFKAVMPYIGHLELKQVHLGALQTFIDERGELGIKSSTMNRTLCVVRLV